MQSRPLLFALFAIALLAPTVSLAVQCNDACPSIVRSGAVPTFIPGIYVGSNAWFDPAYSGQGWSFSELVGAPGQPNVGIGVTYTYETGGQPTWLLLQGTWQRETTARGLLEGQPIAVLSGPVFDGAGGACPTCPFVAPTLAQRRYQNARVIFLRPDVATVELDGQVALSGAGKLVPTEFVVTRPLPTILAGNWRFTRRSIVVGSFTTYEERNFATHGCELTITPVPSPTTENRFVADPAGAPYWLPPSGAQVQWLQLSSFSCTAVPSDTGTTIAVDPGSSGPIRAINLRLSGLVPEFVPNGMGAVASYTVQRRSSFLEFFVQGPDRLIARYHGLNDPTMLGTRNLNFGIELELTRAP